MMRRRRPRRARTLLLVLAIALTVGGCSAEAPSGDREVPELVAVPQPDLTGIEEVVRERLAERRDRVEALTEGASGERLATAYGRLGRLYQAYGFFEAAEGCYTNAVRLDPEEADWPYLRGMVRDARGEQRAAAQDFERVRELTPDDLATQIRLGDVYLALGETGKARQAFRRALSAAPGSAAAHFGLGRVAAEEGLAREAVEHFEAVLELDPSATLVHYRLAQAYRSLGEEARARRHLERRGEGGVSFPDPRGREVSRLKVGTAFDVVAALSEDPEGLDPDQVAQFAIAQFGDLAGAVEEFRRALEQETELEPGARARALYVLGILEVRRGERGAAEESLRQALTLDPDFARARLQLAATLGATGRREAALEELATLLEARPDHVPARLKRAAILTDLGRREEAFAALDEVLRQDPEHGEARLRQAALLAEGGEGERAIAALRRALEAELVPEDRATAHLRLAGLLERRGDVAAAERELTAALEVDPTLLEARRALATLYGRSRRFAAAAEEFRRVVEARPEDAAARLGEATALILAGRHREARVRLEEGVAALPDDLGLARTLARHLAACPVAQVRSGRRAVELAARVLEQEPSLENAETLAMALAEAGRHEEAARTQQELLDRARTAGADPRTLGRLEANLERYRRGQACCAGRAVAGASPG